MNDIYPIPINSADDLYCLLTLPHNVGMVTHWAPPRMPMVCDVLKIEITDRSVKLHLIFDGLEARNRQLQPQLRELLPCPFCGRTTSVKATTWHEINDRDQSGTTKRDRIYTVICSAIKGGCGTTCGYEDSENAAVRKWNFRQARP
jgi:transcription elongation factor Elf1